MPKKTLRDRVLKELEGETCPDCGTAKVALVAYGLMEPDEELQGLIDEGLVIPGRNGVRMENLHCWKCGKPFLGKKMKDRYERSESSTREDRETHPVASDPLHPFWEQASPCSVCGTRVQMRLLQWVEGIGSVCHRCRLKNQK